MSISPNVGKGAPIPEKKHLSVYVTPEELARIRARARSEGLSASAWLRAIALERAAGKEITPPPKPRGGRGPMKERDRQDG